VHALTRRARRRDHLRWVGKGLLRRHVATLTTARHARAVSAARTSGLRRPFDLQRLNSGGSLFVARPTPKHCIPTRDELLWRDGEVLDAVASATLQVEIGGRYPFAVAHQAHEDLI
jgi:NADPH:quinone reductase